MKPNQWILCAVLLLTTLAAHAQLSPAERNKGAVRVLTKEVAQRVFMEFAREKDKAGKSNQIAVQIVDTLARSPIDTNALAVIGGIDRNAFYKAAKDKLTELGTLNLKPVSDEQLKISLRDALSYWYEKHKGEHLAYKKGTHDQAGILTVVNGWLDRTPTTEPVINPADVPTVADDGAVTDSVLSPAQPTQSSGFPLNWLLGGMLLGALLAGGAGYWFWYLPGTKYQKDWQDVSDFVRKLNIPNAPVGRPTLSSDQLTNLIETLNSRAKGNTLPGTQTPSGGDKRNRQLVEQIAALLAVKNTDTLVETVRGLKEDVYRLSKPDTKATQMPIIDKKQPEPAAFVAVVVQPSQTVGSAAAGNAGFSGANKSQSMTIYFAQPSPEGWFDDSERTLRPTLDSCYSFSLPHETAPTATFRFEANVNELPRLLNFRNFFIDPVCESQNNYQPGHTRVVTLDNGKARLTDGQWRVETKAKIRFE